MVCNRISNKLFAAKGEKQDMSTGENIKRIRKFRGMTQKELGIAIGIGEESASPRMAQYETDNRTPRKEMLHKIAVVLDVDPRNISIPTGYREEDMIYRLLVLEDYFPEMKLERNGRTGEVVINLQNKKINEFLYQWGTIKGKKKQGMISEDEYMQWKYCSIHRANHRGSRKDSFREEKCIIYVLIQGLHFNIDLCQYDVCHEKAADTRPD